MFTFLNNGGFLVQVWLFWKSILGSVQLEDFNAK